MRAFNSIKSKFKIALLSKFIKAITGAFLIVFLARSLDPGIYGSLFLALSILSVGKLFSILGFSGSASRYISEYKELDVGQVPHIIRVSFILVSLSTSIIILTLVLLRGEIASIMNDYRLENLLLLGVVYVAFFVTFSYSTSILRGYEKIKEASLLSITRDVLNVLLVFFFVVSGLGAIGALLGYTISYIIIGGISLLYILYKYYIGVETSKIESNLKRRIFEYSLPISLTKSAHVIDGHLDRILVGLFLGPTYVAFYTLGKQIIEFVETPMTALGFTVSPTYGAQKAKGNADTAARIYENVLSYTIILYLPACIGIVLVSGDVVPIIFGEDYTEAVPVIQVLSIFALLQALTKVTGEGLDYLGEARSRAIVKGITSILNIILNVFLILELGVVGAAIATVISFSLYTIFNIFMMFKSIEASPEPVLKKLSLSIISSAAMSIWILKFPIDISGVVSAAVLITTGVFLYIIFSLLIGLISVHELLSFVGTADE